MFEGALGLVMCALINPNTFSEKKQIEAMQNTLKPCILNDTAV